MEKIIAVRWRKGKGNGDCWQPPEFFADVDDATERLTALAHNHGGVNVSMEGMPLGDGAVAIVEWLNQQVK